MNLLASLVIFGFLNMSLVTLSCLASEDAFNQIQYGLSLELGSGQTMTLGRDSFVRQVNVSENINKWYAEVRVVDDDNHSITNDVYRVSRRYLNKSLAVMFMDSLQFSDENGNDGPSIPGGVNVVRLSSSRTPFPHYNVAIVDEEGNAINHEGDVWDRKSGEPYPVYKVRQEVFNRAMLDNKIRELLFISDEEHGVVEGSGCRPTEQFSEEVDEGTSAPLYSIRPVARPSNFSSLSPYERIMGRREELKGKGSCERQRREMEMDMLQSTDWAGTTLHQRADKIYELSKEVLAEVRKVSDDSGENERSSSPFRNSVNPHYFPDAISAELVSCIVFQETEGTLNYMAYNGSYCENTNYPRSTAHGLSQFTRRTFRMIKGHPDGDQAPFLTKFTEPLKEFSAKEAHSELSRYPGAQLEMAFRLLNHEYKRAYVNDRGRSKEQLIRDAVEAYDQDNKSAYLRNVMEDCLPCMNRNGKKGSDCYEEVYE